MNGFLQNSQFFWKRILLLVHSGAIFRTHSGRSFIPHHPFHIVSFRIILYHCVSPKPSKWLIFFKSKNSDQISNQKSATKGKEKHNKSQIQVTSTSQRPCVKHASRASRLLPDTKYEECRIDRCSRRISNRLVTRFVQTVTSISKD